jgi:hypothetical protein
MGIREFYLYEEFVMDQGQDLEEELNVVVELLDLACVNSLEAGEFDWFAVDSTGALTALSTAGFGLIPRILCHKKAEILEIYRWLCLYTPSSPVTVNYYGQVPAEADWWGWVPKGLYWYYNPGDRGAPYRRVGIPEPALHINMLPERLQQYLRPFVLPIAFAETGLIWVPDYWPEV